MRNLLSGLALVALAAGTAYAQPGEGKGKDRKDGPQTERRMDRQDRQAERRADRQVERQAQKYENRAERRVERQAERRAEKSEKQAERRFERQVDRNGQRFEQRAERKADRQGERMERLADRGPERKAERAERKAERQAERNDRRDNRQAERKADRQAERVDRRDDRRAEHIERRVDRKADRQADRSDRRTDRIERQFERDERRADRALFRDDRGDRVRTYAGGEGPRFAGRGRGLIDGCPPGLAKKHNGCLPPGLAKQNNASRNLAAVAGGGLLAGSLTPGWFGYDDYGPDYRYYDGYLLRTRGDDVLGYLPLLGGALAPGQPWLPYYEPNPIPAYWTQYYGLNAADRYRYYDDVIFELGSGYSEIDQIVAILSGDPWAVGRPMPYGYDVYNVPYGYRASYYDSPDRWYRYSDGYLYDIDPTTRLVRAVVQLLGGGGMLSPGQPWRASYRPAPIPDYWNDYYGLEAADRYRYYDDAIYGLNPGRSEVEEIIALHTGDPWGVDQRMPSGYDVYNVPYSYRTRYYDTSDHWYRYSDGYIYDIDPTTRVVLAAIQLLA
jgi:hypothetical protein